MNKGQWGKVKAFFSVRTEEGFIIKGFKLIEGINGMFVGFPSQKGQDDEYYDTVFAERDLKEKLTQLALKEYGGEIMSQHQNDDPFSEQLPAQPVLEDSGGFSNDDIPF